MSQAQKTQRDKDGINQFQKKKLAEQLANGMNVRNATLEQLATKSKKKNVILHFIALQIRGTSFSIIQAQHPSRAQFLRAFLETLFQEVHSAVIGLRIFNRARTTAAAAVIANLLIIVAIIRDQMKRSIVAQYPSRNNGK